MKEKVDRVSFSRHEESVLSRTKLMTHKLLIMIKY